MQIRSGLTHVLLLAALFTGLSAAHADPYYYPGTPALQSATYELQRQVQVSGLGWNVQSAVNNFAQGVQWFSGCSGDCPTRLQYLQQAWNPVNRFLWDTQRDFPRVYQAYVATSQALQNLDRPIEPPAPVYRASGEINGEAFDFSSSKNSGIEEQCLAFVERRKIQTASSLVINKQIYYVENTAIGRVCVKIARVATDAKPD